MEIVKVPLASIRSSAQPRALADADISRLAASIKAVGLINPITVRRAQILNGGLAAQGFQTVAGHHRIAAARSLGWTEIDAIIVDAPEFLKAELIEIDENLCRAELTAAQRAHAIKRRKEIWKTLKLGETGGKTFSTCLADGRKAGPQHEEKFAAETAEASGRSKQSINQQLARAEALGDDALQKVTGTSLDKGVELDALAKLDAPERDDLIERAAAGEDVSARQQLPSPEPERTPLYQRIVNEADDAVERILALTGSDSIAEFSEVVRRLPASELAAVRSSLTMLELIGTLCEGVAA